jgi:hypothetical protein
MVIVAPGSTWECTFVDPTANVDWNTTGARAGSATGATPFGNFLGDGPGGRDDAFAYDTLWTADGIDG